VTSLPCALWYNDPMTILLIIGTVAVLTCLWDGIKGHGL